MIMQPWACTFQHLRLDVSGGLQMVASVDQRLAVTSVYPPLVAVTNSVQR